VHSRVRVLASEMRFKMHCQFFCSRVCPKNAFLQTVAASESELDHANRILSLKVGVLVYTESMLSKCQG